MLVFVVSEEAIYSPDLSSDEPILLFETLREAGTPIIIQVLG
jgi:hypothetical protein